MSRSGVAALSPQGPKLERLPSGVANGEPRFFSWPWMLGLRRPGDACCCFVDWAKVDPEMGQGLAGENMEGTARPRRMTELGLAQDLSGVVFII